jgi:hypothetical protein
MRVMATDQPPCTGKTYEHHERTEPHGEVWRGSWRCAACGDTGYIGDFARSLAKSTGVVLVRLQEQALAEGAVVLVPSIATAGVFGQFMGCPIFRVQGIDRPMVALPGYPLDTLQAVNDELERENGPVTEAELQDVRAEWLGR